MTRFVFTQVDVFTDRALRGNPLAVVHDADALDDAQMQTFARWTNLSETTFLCRPTDTMADYRVRIFTPGGELPFAGHPTLGSCHAWLAAGGCPKSSDEVIQQCRTGLIRVRQRANQAAFAAPLIRTRKVETILLRDVLAALDLPVSQVRASEWLDIGSSWLALHLTDAACVLAIEPNHAALTSLANVGIVGAHPTGHACDFEVRAFAAPLGIPEDPVTGALNAALAQWLISREAAPHRYIASQGTRLDRSGRVHVDYDGTNFWIGGSSVSVIRGEATLPIE